MQINNTNNQVKFFQNSTLNCSDCRNLSMVRDGKDGQIISAKCKHDHQLMLLDFKNKCFQSILHHLQIKKNMIKLFICHIDYMYFYEIVNT